MDIQRNNYEIWAVNYLDGQLEPSEVAQFLAFLSENPDLNAELENLRPAFQDTDNITDKESFNYLKKEYSPELLNDASFEEFCIACHEGDLNANTQEALIDYAEKDAKKTLLLNAYAKLKVRADLSIHFSKKADLLKTTPLLQRQKRNRFVLYSISVAASTIILIGLFFITTDKPDSINDLNSKLLSSIDSIIIDQEQKEETEIKYIHSSAETSTIAVPALNTQINENEEKPIILSAVDTAEWIEPFIQISRIEMPVMKLPSSPRELELKVSNFQYYHPKSNQSVPQLAINTIQNKSSELFGKAGSLRLNTLLEKSVKGINQLAETDLQYNSDIDEDGKIIAFAFSSERFNIKRKMRNN